MTLPEKDVGSNEDKCLNCQSLNQATSGWYQLEVDKLLNFLNLVNSTDPAASRLTLNNRLLAWYPCEMV